MPTNNNTRESLIRYRLSGNCFVNCLVKGCKLLGEKQLQGNNPELNVFNIETLYTPKLENEFPAALNYLINRKFEVYIIDPDDPQTKNSWGEGVFPLVNNNKFEIKNYSRGDLIPFIDRGWCVIISTLDSSGQDPHAVLVFGNRIWDPENETLWNSEIGINKLDEYINRKEERFFIAFGRLAFF